MGGDQLYVGVFGLVQGGWNEWYRWCIDVAQSIGVEFTHYSVSRPDSEASGRTRGFSTAGVQRALRNAPISDASFYVVQESFTQLVFDWGTAMIREVGNFTPGSVFIGFDESLVPSRFLVDVAPGLLEHVVGCYGFGGVLAAGRAPAMYFRGCGTNLDTKEDDEEVYRWSLDLMRARRFAQGFFRAAFPINLLSDLHLARHVGSATLASAIEMGKAPGSLKRINDAITLWEIPDEGLAEAQRILEENTLIV